MMALLFRALALAGILYASLPGEVSADDETRVNFKIVPGKEGTVSASLNTPPVVETTCSFEHKTMGATPEEWELEIRGDPLTGEMFCSVGRASATQTYLMFSQFEITLGTTELAEVSLFNNDGKLLADNQYEVTGARVRNARGWDGQLVGAEVVATLAL